MTLLIEPTVGYMLKVLKSGKTITVYKNEFDSIRHGDYKNFLSLVGGKVPFLVKYNSGKITTEEDNPNYDCDFEGLLKSGNSLRIFYRKCYSHYGNIEDVDITDSIYQKVVLFEIAIRMHANNNNLLSKGSRTDLVLVIEKLCSFKNIPLNEKVKLHQGRSFINMVKHFNNQFPSWTEGTKHFLEGYKVLERHNILII